MKVMTALFGPTDAIDRTRALRDAGASGVFTFEGPHDVFAPLTLASTVGGLDLMTNVAIAFPRSPMVIANQAWDLNRHSKGRFVVGLGSQIKAHNERRFSAFPACLRGPRLGDSPSSSFALALPGEGAPGARFARAGISVDAF